MSCCRAECCVKFCLFVCALGAPLQASGPVESNFKHFLFYSPNSKYDQKYEYFTILDTKMSVFDTFSMLL